MRPRLIVIDGKSYQSINEMPEDVRGRYEQALNALKDQDGNRVPDAFENENIFANKDRDGKPDLIENSEGAPPVNSSIKVVVDGQEYNSLDDLPPEARAMYDQAMGTLDAYRNGIPDFMEGLRGTGQDSTSTASASPLAPRREPRKLMSTPIAGTPDTTTGLWIVLAGVLLLSLCAAGAASVWYFFLR